MPPRAKITREMIIEAAFQVARTKGGENINARTVAEELQCSTQPIMYHFATIQDLRRAAYEKADEFHSAYITNIDTNIENYMLGIGVLYIRFAAAEKHLFRFLFQSDEFSGKSLIDIINGDELVPIIAAMQQAMELNLNETKEVFISLFLLVHGYASMLANNNMIYDEKAIYIQLERAMTGSIIALQEENK